MLVKAFSRRRAWGFQASNMTPRKDGIFSINHEVIMATEQQLATTTDLIIEAIND